jgi:hypothetical protein
MSISQSGTRAQIILNDRGPTILEATIQNSALTAPYFAAAITGKPGARSLSGTLALAGCPPVAFHAVRQTPAARRD